MESGYANNLKLKYQHFHEDGKLVLAVTLSTYVRSESFARSDRMRHFWDQHFMYKVMKRLAPWQREAVDHDYIVERSPEGCWHFHGLLALTAEAGKKIWKDGVLNPQLVRDLNSFRTKGEYRSFRVNAHLIEPIRDGLLPEVWARYITKTSDFLCWTRDERAAASDQTTRGAELATINMSSQHIRNRLNDQHHRYKPAIEVPKAA